MGEWSDPRQAGSRECNLRGGVVVRSLVVARAVPCVVVPQVLEQPTIRPMNVRLARWSARRCALSGWTVSRVCLNTACFQPPPGRRSPRRRKSRLTSLWKPLFGRMTRGSSLLTRPSKLVLLLGHKLGGERVGPPWCKPICFTGRSSLLSRSPWSGYGGPAASFLIAKGSCSCSVGRDAPSSDDLRC